MKYISSFYYSMGQRKSNEDSFTLQQLVIGKRRVFMAAVCDGMGGRAKGETASGYTAEQLTEWFYNGFCHAFKRRSSRKKICRLLERELERVNKELWNYGEERHIRTGTTVCVLILWNKKFIAAAAGDSRIYRIKNKRCRQITKDHTAGRYVLSKCIGMKHRCMPQLLKGSVSGKTGFLLCSDGFWSGMGERELGRVLCSRSIQTEEEADKRLRELGSKIEREKCFDNLTAVYVMAGGMGGRNGDRKNRWRKI